MNYNKNGDFPTYNAPVQMKVCDRSRRLIPHAFREATGTKELDQPQHHGGIEGMNLQLLQRFHVINCLIMHD